MSTTSSSNPLYPNLQISLNQSESSTPADVRLSQSEELNDQNEFVFITDYNQVIFVIVAKLLPSINVLCVGRR